MRKTSPILALLLALSALSLEGCPKVERQIASDLLWAKQAHHQLLEVAAEQIVGLENAARREDDAGNRDRAVALRIEATAYRQKIARIDAKLRELETVAATAFITYMNTRSRLDKQSALTKAAELVALIAELGNEVKK